NIRVLSLLGPDAHSFEQPFEVTWHGNGISLKDKWGMIREVFRLTARWKPDMIWLGHVNLSGMGWVASRITGAVTILNAYGLEIWSKMSGDAALGLRKVDHIVADCHNTADYLVRHKKRKQESVAVIWDCIDTDRFKPAETIPDPVLTKYRIPDPATHFNILSLGRLSKPDAFYKGYDRLLKVFAGLASLYPQLRLVFAGRGNYREDLERMTAEYGLGERVSFTGSVGEDDLAAVYQSCHVFSLITESGEGKGEGIPLTPLEAMACGKPILVGNDDGSREAVIDGLNGFVLDPRDLESHGLVIRRYLDEEQLLAEQSRQAAKLAREHFSYVRFSEKMNNFISNKIARS
ncbi:MAG TPA: glycosyltransferase family 4 protein, partial [Puia sp.]|nr:glycosyltransferase family 4 protein [Puia sp.]